MVGDMKNNAGKYQCKIGIHKWGIPKEEFVDGYVKLARKCKVCGKIKPAKET
jgi:hypothetical protein